MYYWHREADDWTIVIPAKIMRKQYINRNHSYICEVAVVYSGYVDSYVVRHGNYFTRMTKHL